MSRVSIDALLAEYRETPKKMTKEASAIQSTPSPYEDSEIEKMASLLSSAELGEDPESFEEKIAQALILGQTLTAMEKSASLKRKYRE